MSDIDVGQISEALNDKMDRDVNNIDSTGNNNILLALMPDYANAITIDSTSYTAPSCGYVFIYGEIGEVNTSQKISVNGVEISGYRSWTGGWAGNPINITLLVSTGDEITGMSYGTRKFVPCKGII